MLSNIYLKKKEYIFSIIPLYTKKISRIATTYYSAYFKFDYSLMYFPYFDENPIAKSHALWCTAANGEKYYLDDWTIEFFQNWLCVLSWISWLCSFFPRIYISHIHICIFSAVANNESKSKSGWQELDRFRQLGYIACTVEQSEASSSLVSRLRGWLTWYTSDTQ